MLFCIQVTVSCRGADGQVNLRVLIFLDLITCEILGDNPSTLRSIRLFTCYRLYQCSGCIFTFANKNEGCVIDVGLSAESLRNYRWIWLKFLEKVSAWCDLETVRFR